MSAQMLSPAAGPTAGGPADAVAATQRVQQLQALIAQAKQGGSTSSFAAALDAASSSSAGSAATGTTAGTAGPETVGTAGPETVSTVGPETAATAPTELTSPGAIPVSAASTGAIPVSASATGATPVSASATTPPAGSSAATPYDGAIAQAAARYNLDPAVLHGLIQQESGFNPNSRSSAGALGLTQLMPGTASSLGVSNPLDPVQSIEGGARYLSQMMSQFGGNTADALAAYNAGPGAVHQYGGVPPMPKPRITSTRCSATPTPTDSRSLPAPPPHLQGRSHEQFLHPHILDGAGAERLPSTLRGEWGSARGTTWGGRPFRAPLTIDWPGPPLRKATNRAPRRGTAPQRTVMFLVRGRPPAQAQPLRPARHRLMPLLLPPPRHFPCS